MLDAPRSNTPLFEGFGLGFRDNLPEAEEEGADDGDHRGKERALSGDLLDSFEADPRGDTEGLEPL